jgi:hypothetical protein
MLPKAALDIEQTAVVHKKAQVSSKVDSVTTTRQGASFRSLPAGGYAADLGMRSYFLTPFLQQSDQKLARTFFSSIMKLKSSWLKS